MTYDTSQRISYEQAVKRPEGSSIFDLLKIPNGNTVSTVLFGNSIQLDEGPTLFVHYELLDSSQVMSWQDWMLKANAVIVYRDQAIEESIIQDVRTRWPNAAIYDYGSMCCSDDYPERLF